MFLPVKKIHSPGSRPLCGCEALKAGWQGRRNGPCAPTDPSQDCNVQIVWNKTIPVWCPDSILFWVWISVRNLFPRKNQLVIFHSSDFRQLIPLNTGLEIPDVHAHKSSVEDCTGTGAIEKHSDCKGFLPCRTWCVPVQVRRTFAQCFAQCPSCCQRTPKLLLGPCEMREASEDPNFYQECLWVISFTQGSSESAEQRRLLIACCYWN